MQITSQGPQTLRLEGHARLITGLTGNGIPVPLGLKADGALRDPSAAPYSPQAVSAPGAAVTKTLPPAGAGICNVIKGYGWSSPFGITVPVGATVSIMDGATLIDSWDVAPGP